MNQVIANGKPVAAELPCSLESFLLAQKLLPRSVVVEHNGEAVAPSEFSRRTLQAGDRLQHKTKIFRAKVKGSVNSGTITISSIEI